MEANETLTMEESTAEESLPDYEAAVEAAVAAKNEAEEKYRRLEARLFCIENGISPENAEDVILLAERLGTDMKDAIPAVIEKYPFFAAKGKAEVLTTGVHISVSPSAETSGVEAAFRKSNPNVKF